MEAFGEVYLGFILFNARIDHGIVLVTDQVFRDKSA